MVTKTHVCPKCLAVITYEEGADLYEVVADHILFCKGAPAVVPHKRITDVVPPEVMTGNIVSIESVLEQELLVTAFDWRDSTFKEDASYLSLTILIEGEEKTVNTGAERVIAVFKSVDPGALPIYCAFEKIQLPNGRRVYRVK